MPNWCNNHIRIEGNIKEIATLLEENKTNEKGLFDTLIGKSNDYTEENWYYHNLDRYGTKWDIWIEECSFDINDDTIDLSLDTAWSPPLSFCQELSKKYNVQVRCEYEEGGCDFAGYTEFKNGKEISYEQWNFIEGLYNLNKDTFWNEIQFLIDEELIDMYNLDFMDIDDKIYIEELKTMTK